eukprot:jgi/Orpsp1_1/1187595/evm.model.d7180000058924.1
MKLSSGILALLAASQVFSYSIDGLNKRQAKTDEDICKEKVDAEYEECLFLDNEIGKVSAETFCPIFNSEKCQSIYNDKLYTTIPECKNLSQYYKDVFFKYSNTYTFIAAYICNKDENNEYCPYNSITSKADPDLNELKSATEATCKSKKCTEESIKSFNKIASSVKNLDAPGILEKVNYALTELKSDECNAKHATQTTQKTTTVQETNTAQKTINAQETNSVQKTDNTSDARTNNFNFILLIIVSVLVALFINNE